MSQSRSRYDSMTVRVGRYTAILDESVRLLVIDDDPIQREFASVYLASPSAEIVTAPSAERGLVELRRERFDLVLVDHEMPGMSGIEFISAVRADDAFFAMPIIMVTSHEDISTIDRAYQAGATSFATKPVNWRLLSYQIRYVLRAQRLIEEANGHD